MAMPNEVYSRAKDPNRIHNKYCGIYIKNQFKNQRLRNFDHQFIKKLKHTKIKA